MPPYRTRVNAFVNNALDTACARIFPYISRMYDFTVKPGAKKDEGTSPAAPLNGKRNAARKRPLVS